MKIYEYDRNLAVNYAREWAYKRNPKYYDFSSIGGDCTNFVSQCIFSGCSVMNYSANGWYYISLQKRSPSWTGVENLFIFLTENNKATNKIGPFAEETQLIKCSIGDVVQLGNENKFFHTAIIVDYYNDMPLVASHSRDTFASPLSVFSFNRVRYLKILGYGK